MAAVAWYLMQAVIIRQQGPDSPLRRALGADLKGKLSPFLYLTGIGAAFVSTAARRPALSRRGPDVARPRPAGGDGHRRPARRRDGRAAERGLARGDEIRQEETCP